MKVGKVKTCVAALTLLVVFMSAGCRARRELPPSAGPVNVVVARVASAEAGREFAYSGTMMESEALPQSFSVTGTVTRVLVDEGDFVAKGAVLAEIDDTTYLRALDMARASEKQAEDAFNRLSKMYREGNIPEIKYVEVSTGLEKARAAAAIAEKNAADCRLKAGVSGYVGKRSIEPGQVVMPSLDSITLVRIDKVYARVPVPEDDVALLHKGYQAVVRIGALGGREFEGRIEDIGVVADSLAHAYKIRIAVANPDLVIRPGMVCKASIRGLEMSSGMVLPNQAVLVDETGRNYVYCLDQAGARVSVRNIKLGELLQNGIRVTDGLKDGDLVVVAGQHELVDGAAVRVVER